MNIKGLEKHPFERMIYVIQRSKSERMALCTLRVEHCEMNASDEMGGDMYMYSVKRVSDIKIILCRVYKRVCICVRVCA